MQRRHFIRTLVLGSAAGFRPWLEPRRSGAAWSAAAAPPVVGLNSHMLTPSAIARLRDLGIVHVRHTLYWPLWERPGYADAFATSVARAHAAGLRLLLVVHNWAGGRVFSSGVSRRIMRELAAFVAARAGELPQVEAWQLWNEQDVWVQAPFGASTGVPMVQRGRLYAEQLEIAYPLIKRANPGALVVSGGIAAGADSGFLAGMMESGPPVDAVAVHAYGGYPALREKVLAARAIVGARAPIWATEAGENTDDDSRQLEAWRQIIDGNAAEGLAARVYPYVLEAGETERGHGLLRKDATVRPAYRWLRSRTRD